jgi:hypothetical protein
MPIAFLVAAARLQAIVMSFERNQILLPPGLLPVGRAAFKVLLALLASSAVITIWPACSGSVAQLNMAVPRGSTGCRHYRMAVQGLSPSANILRADGDLE